MKNGQDWGRDEPESWRETPTTLWGWRNVPLDRWLVRYLMLPGLALFAAWMGGTYLYNVERCRRLAAKNGYMEFLYVPGGRLDTAKCLCKKMRNLDGTIDEKAQRVIPLR